MDLGTSLGAVSLAFQLFGGCIQGFILLSAAHNAGKVGASLLCQLSIQELRLTEWARRSGLLNSGSLDVRLNSVVVNTVLVHLQDLLGDAGKLSQRYKLKLVVPRPDDLYQEDFTSDQSVLLGAAISDDVRRDVLWRARLIHDRNSLPKRLWWAAVDRDKFKDMIAEVKQYVQELWSLLDPLTQDDMLQRQQVILASVLNLTDRLQDVRALQDAFDGITAMSDQLNKLMPLSNVAAVKIACMETNELLGQEQQSSRNGPNVCWAGNLAVTHHEGAKPDQMDTVGVEDLQSETKNDEADLGTLQDTSVDRISHFSSVSTQHNIGIAEYDGHNVLVEWKDIAAANRWQLIRRVQQLARVLHVPKLATFRSLHCCALAMADDASRAGFIFHLPAPEHRHAISLRDILGGKMGLISPSVGARIRLALAVLRSMQLFHTAGWMHKDLRSENILFFRSNAPGQVELIEEELEQPYIVGFAFARVDAPSEISERPSTDLARDIYRHPHALSGIAISYQPFMDLYSLGAILIEIAEWRPLSTLVREVVDVRKDSVPLTQLAAVRSFLCDASINNTAVIKLDFRMGKKFARATRLCLGAEATDGTTVSQGRESGSNGSALSLLNIVVEELQSCQV